MRISKPKRARGGAKRLDLSDMRHVFKDTRLWTAMGIVTAPEDGEHWEIVTNDAGDAVDVLVEVVLQPSEEPHTCRLRSGMWEVPAVGDEVVVVFPDGARDFMPIVICRLASNSVPTNEGPEPGRIVIVAPNGGTVLIHDGSGGTSELALKSDVAKIETAILGATITPSDGGATLKATISAGLATSLHDVDGLTEWPVGTTVLKAK